MEDSDDDHELPPVTGHRPGDAFKDASEVPDSWLRQRLKEIHSNDCRRTKEEVYESMGIDTDSSDGDTEETDSERYDRVDHIRRAIDRDPDWLDELD